MTLDIAKSAMALIARLGGKGQLEASGISLVDFRKLTGDDPWLLMDRNRMTATLQCLIYGSVDALGLPRFPLPAEYVAAGIAMFVSPVNIHAACRFVSDTNSAEDLSKQVNSRETSLPERVNPERIFALVVQLYGDQTRSQARTLFEKSTGIALDKVTQKNVG